MKRYIAYFDFLGFKQFLENNSEEYLKIRSEHILRDIEMALSDGDIKKSKDGLKMIADTSHTSINCLNISDTIIFWTNDDSIDSLKDLIKVAYRFNWQENLFNFPVRGYITYDLFNIISGRTVNKTGSIYSPNLMYGKGLLNAHLNCESLNWAGVAIDNSVVEKVRIDGDFHSVISEYGRKYNVPYKGYYKKGYVLDLGKFPITNKESFESKCKSINQVFESDSKSITPSVKEKISNTIKYIEANCDFTNDLATS